MTPLAWIAVIVFGLFGGAGHGVLVGNGKTVNGADYLAGTAAAYLLMVAGVALMAWLEHDND